MEFWSGILGAIIGGTIALAGTVFASVYEQHCRKKSELRIEKKRLYTDICNILGNAYRISVIVDSTTHKCPTGRIDPTSFSRISEELGAYLSEHTGEIVLYLPNTIYSALMRISSDLYELSTMNLRLSIETFDSDFEQMKQIMAKVSDLENKIKNDLYPANLNK